MLAVESVNLKVMPGVEIFSGFTLLYAEDTVEMMEGSKLKSSKRTMCNLNKHAHDMYTYVPQFDSVFNILWTFYGHFSNISC